MSEVLNVAELAATGAAALVAEMARTTWQSVRDAMARVFGWGNEEPEAVARQLLQLDAGYELLNGTEQADQEAVANALRTTLGIQLQTFLRQHPEAAGELRALVQRSEASEPGGDGGRVIARNNTNSQVVISGGSIIGNTLHYRPEATQ
ncbi:hypothetical protein OG389_16190 [Streptomyces sp. NBC_00435]|uniref:hypothetical protein n=1 Tax=Streptomyces sp. NBC_00435 TaxID=2903649 RepID=UPI002E243139